jgi:ferrochelatase
MSQTENPKKGVILVNLGSPVAPDAGAVRAFLGRFLSDKRVVELPAYLWRPLLHCIILPLRAQRVASLYRAIWTSEGSPLVAATRKQVEGVQQLCPDMAVTYAMSYGEPSIANAVASFRAGGVESILVLPLYPQYSGTTTGAVYDQVAQVFRQARYVPDIRVVRHYAERADYIKALAESVRQQWSQCGRGDLLLFSFHGIPKRCVDKGDPYESQCHSTAVGVARELELDSTQWQLCYQSRFGKAEWLQPYTDEVLSGLPSRGVKSVDVICPAFASDCLETLEEIEVGSRAVFMETGGTSFNRIPCLNDSTMHLQVLAAVIKESFVASEE